MIEIRNLTKQYRSTRAVDNLSFTVEQGQIVGFLGPNGAGKTTTMRILLGLVAPTAGSATINGRTYRDLPDPLHAVGAALEASSFHPTRTARNHLRIHAWAGRTDARRVAQVLDLVDLTSVADRRVGGYSLGMRQRLGLATALLNQPDILVLDEPANGLDPEGVRWLRELLRNQADNGATILVSSHILAEVAQTVDSIVILDHGRLVTHTSLAQLTTDLTPPVQVRTARPDVLAPLLVAEGGAVSRTADGWLEVTGLSTEQIGTLAAIHSVPIYETKLQQANLEDVFMNLTAPAARSAVDGASHA